MRYQCVFFALMTKTFCLDTLVVINKYSRRKSQKLISFENFLITVIRKIQFFAKINKPLRCHHGWTFPENKGFTFIAKYFKLKKSGRKVGVILITCWQTCKVFVQLLIHLSHPLSPIIDLNLKLWNVNKVRDG